MQAAVTRNTQPLVQRSIAAGAVDMSKLATSAAVVLSPSGQMIAWVEGVTLKIEDRCARRSMMSQSLSSRALPDAICWSPDSSCFTVLCDHGVWAAAPVSCGLRKVYSSPLVLSTNNRCFWAPCGQAVAVAHLCSLCSMLSLFRMPSRELLMEVPRGSSDLPWYKRPHISRVAWAANGKTLAIICFEHISILDTNTQRQLQDPFPCTARCLTAWSPCSWEAPGVLCFVYACDGLVVRFVDSNATVKGGCMVSFLGHDARTLLWGEHGLIIKTNRGLWLCDVCSRDGGLQLDVRHTFNDSEFCRPVLSPDQVHLCIVRLSTDRSTYGTVDSRSKFWCRPEIWDIVSTRRVFISPPESVSAFPSCTFTSRGFSLAVNAVTNRDKDHVYAMLKFV